MFQGRLDCFKATTIWYKMKGWLMYLGFWGEDRGRVFDIFWHQEVNRCKMLLHWSGHISTWSTRWLHQNLCLRFPWPLKKIQLHPKFSQMFQEGHTSWDPPCCSKVRFSKKRPSFGGIQLVYKPDIWGNLASRMLSGDPTDVMSFHVAMPVSYEILVGRHWLDAAVPWFLEQNAKEHTDKPKHALAKYDIYSQLGETCFLQHLPSVAARTVVCEVLENKSRTIELLNEFRARGYIGVGVKKSVGSCGGVKTSFSSIKK